MRETPRVEDRGKRRSKGRQSKYSSFPAVHSVLQLIRKTFQDHPADLRNWVAYMVTSGPREGDRMENNKYEGFESFEAEKIGLAAKLFKRVLAHKHYKATVDKSAKLFSALLQHSKPFRKAIDELAGSEFFVSDILQNLDWKRITDKDGLNGDFQKEQVNLLNGVCGKGSKKIARNQV